MRKIAKICHKCKLPLRLIDKHENECMWYCDKCKEAILPQDNLRDVPNNTNMNYDFPSGDNSSSFHAAGIKFSSISKIFKIIQKLEKLGYKDLSNRIIKCSR